MAISIIVILLIAVVSRSFTISSLEAEITTLEDKITSIEENELRPRDLLAFPECTMNGAGVGQCPFANEGNKSDVGSVVVTLYELNEEETINWDKPVASITVNSGEVKPYETKVVSFDLPTLDANEKCLNSSYGSIFDKCHFQTAYKTSFYDEYFLAVHDLLLERPKK